EYLAVGRFEAAQAVGAVLGDVEGVGDVDFELVALGLHGLGQDNLHARIAHAVVGFQLLAVQLDGHGAQRVAALKAPRRVAEAPARRGRGRRPARVGPEQVLVDLQPHEG
nr:hypothetical protein [Tanacetum cinerariifolium]